MKWPYLSTVAALSLATSVTSAAHAQSKLMEVDPTLIEENQPAPPSAATPVKKGRIVKGPAVAPTPGWLDTLTIDGYVEGGIAAQLQSAVQQAELGPPLYGPRQLADVQRRPPDRAASARSEGRRL